MKHPKHIRRHRRTPRPTVTPAGLVAVFHDTLWRHVDDGRSIDDAAALARMDMQDRMGLVAS